MRGAGATGQLWLKGEKSAEVLSDKTRGRHHLHPLPPSRTRRMRRRELRQPRGDTKERPRDPCSHSSCRPPAHAIRSPACPGRRPEEFLFSGSWSTLTDPPLTPALRIMPRTLHVLREDLRNERANHTNHAIVLAVGTQEENSRINKNHGWGSDGLRSQGRLPRGGIDMRDNRHFGGSVGTDYGKSALAGPGASGNTWHLGTQRGRPGGRGPCLRGACCDSSGCMRTKCRGQEREGKG